MTTFITRLPGSGDGIRLAVKDLIDVTGVPTTAGSRALAATAAPAESDAPCLAGARAAGARIVGKANLDELAFGASGVNAYFGTPVNPLDPGRVPGQPRESGRPSGAGPAGAERAAAARQPAADRRAERGGAAACHRAAIEAVVSGPGQSSMAW